MAKTVLKPIDNKILINRKTRCRFSFSQRALENPDVGFIPPKSEEQAKVINAIEELTYKMDKVKTTLARAKKFRDVRWVEELTIELAELQEELDNELYPEIDRVYVETAEALRRQEEGSSNVTVNLDSTAIAEAITAASGATTTETPVETVKTVDSVDTEETLDMELEE